MGLQVESGGVVQRELARVKAAGLPSASDLSRVLAGPSCTQTLGDPGLEIMASPRPPRRELGLGPHPGSRSQPEPRRPQVTSVRSANSRRDVDDNDGVLPSGRPFRARGYSIEMKRSMIPMHDGSGPRETALPAVLPRAARRSREGATAAGSGTRCTFRRVI
jgi:hypothetical protein